MTRWLLGFIAATLAPAGLSLDAQVGSGTPRPPATLITGIVYDSLGWAPLEGAVVQLVVADRPRDIVRSAVTGATGGFRLADVPRGRYLIGFLHPALEALGLEMRGSELAVGDSGSMQVVLTLPSAQGLRLHACGGEPTAPGSMLMGVVRDPGDEAPVPGAVVKAKWVEYDLGRAGPVRREADASDTTGANGGYVLCDVPEGTLALHAARSGERTSTVEVEIPSTRFMLRHLYLARATSGASRTELRGRVVAADDGSPVAGALVNIEGARPVEADSVGAWTLSGVTRGTRMLEVRKLGYVPARLPIDVTLGVPSVEVSLTEVRTVLDTVQVSASASRLVAEGFHDRVRAGLGRYITEEDMARRLVINTVDVFETIPNLKVERTMLGDTRIRTRGPFGDCEPSVYVDGHHMERLTAEDVNAFVSPDEVAGMEFYLGAFIPAQFNPGLTGCGSIVIWTKQRDNPARGWSMRRRVLHGVGAGILGAVIGMLVWQL